ncbi:1-acyl-sn-glycerol-3-phosphate acyltransferase [Deinococcus irradiatisoli]|uniref:1-acyl-sn-glycerol-3-phosphate acyltransferase n=1 Tax=Deinococcus irradiatisoli TaxID=2202254 RepID=A0A2Z3JH42_9DEIO|nr:lysophospholipid acyltransferase family protein [Deinococcus irradiatisoli]AWN24325.1 1-acyl-sn-glycerol-3-phosphate acyltransferase [Deinococcus irradiatisoli]
MTAPLPEPAPQHVQARPLTEDVHAPPVNPLVYQLVVVAMNLPLLLRGEYIHTLGREHIPPPGSKLVVAGAHVSALDPFIIAKAMPGHHVQFMSKKELFKPVIGSIIKAGGSFPVDRSSNDVVAIRTALRILKEDGTLGLFPEGTRGGGQMQGGVALLALRGRAPVLPVGLRRDGKRWLVRFGPLIDPKGGIKDLTAQIGEEITRLSAPLGP